MFPSPDQSNGILFLSDVHLGGFTEERNRRIEWELSGLLDHCDSLGYRICILGDLFDYWMEYPGHRPDLGRDLLERFERYNNPDHPTLFITGNHDHWTGPLLPSIGFRLEHGWHRMELGGEQLLLMHGDGKPDRKMEMQRPLMHRILRNRTFISWYQKVLPPSAGLEVMRRFSRFNRSMSGIKGGTGELNRWSARFLEHSEFDRVLCGHDHVPRVTNWSYGTFMNLGTFYHHRSCVCYTKGQFTHVLWNNSDRKLTPYNPVTEDE